MCVLCGVVPLGVVVLFGVACSVALCCAVAGRRAPMNSATLLLGGYSSSQPEPEITEPNLQVSGVVGMMDVLKVAVSWLRP